MAQLSGGGTDLEGQEFVADFYGYCERDFHHEIYPGTDVGMMFGHIMCADCFHDYREVYSQNGGNF